MYEILEAGSITDVMDEIKEKHEKFSKMAKDGGYGLASYDTRIGQATPTKEEKPASE